jgi:hypothetical protein
MYCEAISHNPIGEPRRAPTWLNNLNMGMGQTPIFLNNIWGSKYPLSSYFRVPRVPGP